MNRTLRTLSFLIFLTLPLSLHAITADEILDEFSQQLAIPDLSASFKVQLVSKKGDVREIEARGFQKNVDENQNNRLFIFDFPPSVRGTGLLLHSYFDGRKSNMWLYLPAVKRVKRIALESSGGGYFMGSDFTYKDLMNNDYNKMDYELTDDAQIDGEKYYVIKSWGKTAKVRQDFGYAYILSYYRKDDFFMMRREYFDSHDDLLKIYQVESLIDIGNQIYPDSISMTNVQSGHKSYLVVDEISVESIPDRYFTTRYLKDN